MRIPPERLPLHESRVDTSAGTWRIAVESAMESQTGSTILLKLVLEQTIDEEHFHRRELGMTVYAAEACDSEVLGEMLNRIGHWIETTEGDGFLDLSNRANHV